MANHPYQPQQQQVQAYKVPTAGNIISSKPLVPVLNLPTPPPVAVPQPQAAPASAPLQDLLSSLDSLHHQPPGADLHLQH